MTTDTPSIAIEQIAATHLPIKWGSFFVRAFVRNYGDQAETAIALIKGNLKNQEPLVRIHSQCITGEALGSLRCDCAAQLDKAMSAISEEGAGVLIYELQEGRGIGLMAKLQAYELQDHGLDTVQANEYLGLPVDCRDFALPVQILRVLGLRRVRLMTNSPAKVEAVETSGIRVVERVPCEVVPDLHARFYLETKRKELGHLLAPA